MLVRKLTRSGRTAPVRPASGMPPRQSKLATRLLTLTCSSYSTAPPRTSFIERTSLYLTSKQLHQREEGICRRVRLLASASHTMKLMCSRYGTAPPPPPPAGPPSNMPSAPAMPPGRMNLLADIQGKGIHNLRKVRVCRTNTWAIR